jgi:hypothetical protein
MGARGRPRESNHRERIMCAEPLEAEEARGVPGGKEEAEMRKLTTAEREQVRRAKERYLEYLYEQDRTAPTNEQGRYLCALCRGLLPAPPSVHGAIHCEQCLEQMYTWPVGERWERAVAAGEL